MFPDPRFLLFVLQNVVGYKNKIKCGLMSTSMKWRHLGHLQLLSSAVALVTGMAKMEVSPQEEMANSQGIKMFAIERHRPPEDFVYFRALCGVQSSPPVLAPKRPIVWGSLQQ